MGCLYCRKNISPLRKLKDPHFCTDEHRKKFASKSARALREAEDLYGFGSNINVPKPEEKPDRKAGFGGTIFVGSRRCPRIPPPPRPSRLCRIIRTITAEFLDKPSAI